MAATGTKLPFTTDQIQSIQAHLFESEQWRDLAIFMTGVDSLLRGCDLRRLRVADVQSIDREVRSRFIIKQQKTQRTVECVLSKPTRHALRHWIEVSQKESGDFLFTSHAPNCSGCTPMTMSALRNSVKKWARLIGLDPARYSTKSLRKSRVRPILEAADLDYQIPQILLGHADIRSTIYYAGLSVERALEVSEQVQVFRPLTDFLDEKPKKSTK